MELGAMNGHINEKFLNWGKRVRLLQFSHNFEECQRFAANSLADKTEFESSLKPLP